MKSLPQGVQSRRETAPQQFNLVRSIRRDEAGQIRKLLCQANSYREALELLDKHINAL